MNVQGNGNHSCGEAIGVMTEDQTEGPETRSIHPVNGSRPASQESLPDLLEERELMAILEAMLFVSPEPLSLDRLASVLCGGSKEEVEQALQRLTEDYDRQGRGLQLVQVAGGYRFVTRAEYAPWIKRLERAKPAPKLSRSALEALAIVAYKQPIVRAEIEGIRGVETSGVLRTLLERKLVRMVGRKDVPGRPIMYGTTKFFLEHFGLRDLSELPPLREFKELGEPEQENLPVGDEPLVIGESESQARAPIPAVDSAGAEDTTGETSIENVSVESD